MMPSLLAQDITSVQPMSADNTSIEFPKHIVLKLHLLDFFAFSGKYQISVSDFSPVNYIRLSYKDSHHSMNTEGFLSLLKHYKNDNLDIYKFLFEDNAEYLI